MFTGYRELLGAAGHNSWQLCPLGGCLEANLMIVELSRTSLVEQRDACLDTSWSLSWHVSYSGVNSGLIDYGHLLCTPQYYGFMKNRKC